VQPLPGGRAFITARGWFAAGGWLVPPEDQDKTWLVVVDLRTLA
jgi:hypothetical protein